MKSALKDELRKIFKEADEEPVEAEDKDTEEDEDEEADADAEEDEDGEGEDQEARETEEAGRLTTDDAIEAVLEGHEARDVVKAILNWRSGSKADVDTEEAEANDD